MGAWQRRSEHLGTLGAEHVVEPATELRVTVANNEVHPWAPFAQRQEEVAGLLGDPGAVGVGGHASEVDSAGARSTVATSLATQALIPGTTGRHQMK